MIAFFRVLLLVAGIVPENIRARATVFIVSAVVLLLVFVLGTLTVFPILVFMYVRLAKCEQRNARTQFGEAYTSLRGEHA